MATIHERSAKSGETQFQAIVRLKGHSTACATFKRKTDAKRWIQETETAIRDGRFFKTAEARRRTLNDAIDRYIATVAPKRREQQKAELHLAWWRKQLGDRLLADITPVLLTEYREKLESQLVSRKRKKGKEDEKKRSASTVNKYLYSLSHLFRVAVEEWGWVQENPVRKIAKLKIENSRTRFLSDTERDKLLKACSESYSPFLYPVVLTALMTGARFEEIITLTWSQVDLQRNVILLLKTKNSESRAVPLAPQLKAELLKLRAVPRIDTDYLFPRKDGQKPIELRKHWYVAVEKAGIEDFKFHDLRHTAASYLAMSGATLLELANILGHKTLQMVKRYAHLTEQHTHEVVGRMTDKYF